MDQDIKLLIVNESDQVDVSIQPILQKYSAVEYTTPVDIMKEIDRIAPDIVIVIKPTDDSSVELVQSIATESPNAEIIFLTEEQDFLLLREIIRSGAVDFLVIPDESAIFEDRLENVIKQVHAREAEESKGFVKSGTFKRGRGQVISFYSGKGGSGKTFLSSAFAQTLKLESTAQILLLDLNLQYGGIETFLSIESNRSLMDLRPVIDELNENHIRNVTEKEKHSKLEILLSPKDAETAESVSDDFIARLIRACRRSYDFVIIDLPSVMNEKTYVALEESDKIYYVMNLDTPSIRVFKNVEELFQRLSIDTTERLHIIVNQTGRDNEINKKDLKMFISHPITAEIRRDFKGIQPLINQGVPIRKEAKEKKLTNAAKDIKKWVLSTLS